MSEKIVLIDGHSILNRAFFGLPDLTNSAGQHTNAVYGFLNILFKILEEEKPEYLTVAFDVHAPTFRHNMYDAYKGTRKPMAQELREQVPLMKEVLSAMGVTIVEKAGYEADDILGTIAGISEKAGLEVSLVSGDRDLLQLASEHIKIRIPKTKRTGTEIEDYYASDVKEKYQVTPTQFIDVKALMGDSADNISGVPGIGEKTATNLIVSYQSIENAYAHVEEIKPNRAKEALREHYDMAQMSKVLATIKTDCELDYMLESAKLGELYTKEAYALFQKLEFKNLLSRFEIRQETPQIQKHFQWISSKEEARQAVRRFEEEFAGKDLGLEFFCDQGRLCGAAAAFGDTDIYFLECAGDGKQMTLSFLEEEPQPDGDMDGDELLDLLRPAVQKAGRISSMDVKTAAKYIEELPQKKCFDTAVASYLLNPLKNEYNTEDIAASYTGMMLQTRQELLGKRTFGQAIQETKQEFLVFACNQAYTSFAAAGALEKELKEQQMWELFLEVEMPLVFTLAGMEKEGIRAERPELEEYGKQLAFRIDELERSIYDKAGETFNINSPKQLGQILFDKLKMPNGKKTKTGYSTAADVLEKLAADHPIVAEILEYRQLAKLKSTYADGLSGCIREDGRIHSTFHQTITATGRISSTDPNLQNIPIRMELGRLIRKVFVPKDGYVFVDADYSQIELRVLAHMSGDEQLIQAYREAQDIHTLTASQVFHVPFEEVTPLMRRNAKAVNFGIVYGISSFGLSQDLSITRKEAEDYIEKYFESYPKIRTFLNGLVDFAKENGYARTMFHRRRPVPELTSGNFMQRSFGERVAMNSPIQGTAADIIKIAMNRVAQRLKKENLASKLLLQVHDELLVETKKEELEQVQQILKEEMECAAHLEVALEIDMHTGNSWYEAK
ncbi:MAG: DNA polymerase I [Eubacterium sp.]|nr:DNA polymerase I [Eubacterium sp.]